MIQKRAAAVVVSTAFVAVLGLSGCSSIPSAPAANGGLAATGGTSAATTPATTAATQSPTPTPAPKPVDLTGEWKQTNSGSTDAWQAATITGTTIEVNWVADNGDTTSLYWAGSFTAPTEPGESFSWTSSNDHSKTDAAMLASSDDTKDFKYENGVISYKVSAMGTTTTVKLARQ